MSVVNKMLNDLESRQQLEAAQHQLLQKDYVAPSSNKIIYAGSFVVFTISSLDNALKVKSVLYDANLCKRFGALMVVMYCSLVLFKVLFSVMVSPKSGPLYCIVVLLLSNSLAIGYIPRSLSRFSFLGNCTVTPGLKSYIGSSN